MLDPNNTPDEISIRFSYDPDASNGPNNWKYLHALSDQETTKNSCGGNLNSPIAIQTTARTCNLFVDYIFETGNCTLGDVTFKLLNHAIETTYPWSRHERDRARSTESSGNGDFCKPSSVQLPDMKEKKNGATRAIFDFEQLHVHAGSEHSLDGTFFGAELHIVYRMRTSGKSPDHTRLAIFGIFITTTNDDSTNTRGHPGLDRLLVEWDKEFQTVLARCSKNLTNTSPKVRTIYKRAMKRRRNNNVMNSKKYSEIFKVQDFIPQGTSFYAYNGSLTTPPCSEIVAWSIASQPLVISSTQMQVLLTIILNYVDPQTCQLDSVANPTSKTTCRPIQPRNGRAITHICPSTMIHAVSQQNHMTRSIATSSFYMGIAGALAIVGLCLLSRSKKRKTSVAYLD